MKRLLLLLSSAALLGCGETAPETTPLEIRFAARAGDPEIRCGGAVSNVGTTSATYELSDFRFYVHDVRGVDADGEEVSLPLIADGTWQSADVALVDFEDKTGRCTEGTVETRDRVVVAAPTRAITGLRFRVGVPESLNHGDASIAESPLNLSTMFWGWKAGYKHLRLDGHTTIPFAFHLGSNGCDGDPVVCSLPGQFEVRLDAFEPATHLVVADVAALFQSTNLEANVADTPPGCMASPASDPDCGPLFEQLGLGDSPGQAFFRAAPAP